MTQYLREKREELIFAMDSQGYNFSQIGEIFGIDRATVLRILRKKPKNWKVKWVKVEK